MWQLQKVDMPWKMGWMKGCILLTQRHLRHLTYTLFYDKCNTPGPHVLNLWDLGEAYLRRLFRGQLYCLFALAAILAAFDCSSDFLELVNCFVRQKTELFSSLQRRAAQLNKAGAAKLMLHWHRPEETQNSYRTTRIHGCVSDSN